MNPLQYCKIYKIPEPLADLLAKLDKRYWYLFHTKKVIYMMERNIEICVGYYDTSHFPPKKVDLTNTITRACVDADYMFKAFNDAKRGGVKGQKLKIYF